MKHDTNYSPRIGLLLLCLIFLYSLVGCKSIQSVTEQTRTQTTEEITDEQSADTLNITGQAVKIEADTSTVTADERGTVEIQRDSVGRPVLIIWTRNLDFTGSGSKWGLHDFSVTGVAASNSSERSRSENIDKEKVEDKKTEIRTPSIENVIGAALMGFLLLLLLLCFFQDVVLPWIKRKLRL